MTPFIPTDIDVLVQAVSAYALLIIICVRDIREYHRTKEPEVTKNTRKFRPTDLRGDEVMADHPITSAHHAVLSAEHDLEAAQRRLDARREQLTVALSEAGWRPLMAVQGPGNEPLLVAPDGSGDAFPRSQVVEFLAAKEAA
jgi:hypothetical protein